MELSLREDTWAFRVLGVDCEVHEQSADVTRISIGTRKPPSTSFIERLFEGLQLVLGRPIDWTVAEVLRGKSFEVRVRSRKHRPASVGSYPPIDPTYHPSPRRGGRGLSHRRMVEQYLKHTYQYTGRRHPLWGLVSAVWESATAEFIDTHALTLCVAVEAVLRLEFADIGVPPEGIEKEVAALKRLLAENYEDPLRLRPRLDGMLSQFQTSRPQDKLRELAEKGLVRQGHVAAWQSLRNTSAHTFQVSRATGDRMREQLFQTMVLFHQLLFAAIRYRGSYVDYSESGWPPRMYPDKP